jgi:hypothetical protein
MFTEINGHAIYWNGHLCEGDRMHPSDPGTFILWTRCGQQDVPPPRAREFEPLGHITCPVGRQLLH